MGISWEYIYIYIGSYWRHPFSSGISHRYRISIQSLGLGGIGLKRLGYWYSEENMGSQLELRIEFPKHMIDTQTAASQAGRQADRHTHIHTYLPTYIHTYIHIYTYTHTHTYIYIYIYYMHANTHSNSHKDWTVVNNLSLYISRILLFIFLGVTIHTWVMYSGWLLISSNSWEHPSRVCDWDTQTFTGSM